MYLKRNLQEFLESNTITEPKIKKKVKQLNSLLSNLTLNEI